MYTEDIIVDYRGFKPSQRTADQLKNITDSLLNESPSESFMKATFVQAGKKGYMGIVKINSSVGSFFARASGYDINNLSDKLVGKIRKQLNQWKTSRFDEPPQDSKAYGGAH